MSGGWKDSQRKSELPDNWGELREAQLQKDGFRCVWILPSGRRCPHPATDVDHYGAKWNHKKLRSLCGTHHDKRTAKQGAAAKRPATFVPRRKKQQPPS
jgi:5-methylcytosine-specific restriction protein A